MAYLSHRVSRQRGIPPTPPSSPGNAGKVIFCALFCLAAVLAVFIGWNVGQEDIEYALDGRIVDKTVVGGLDHSLKNVFVSGRGEDYQYNTADKMQQKDQEEEEERLSEVLNVTLTAVHFTTMHDVSLEVTDSGASPPRASNKPWLVLHCGPAKTGTTYLQSTLPYATNILDQDNYAFLGSTYESEKFPELFKQDIDPFFDQNDPTAEKLAPKLRKNLQQITTEKKNGLIVFENTKMFMYKLMPHLLSSFHIKVVAVYRRLYELLPSAYAQIIDDNLQNFIKHRCAPELFQAIFFSPDVDDWCVKKVLNFNPPFYHSLIHIVGLTDFLNDMDDILQNMRQKHQHTSIEDTFIIDMHAKTNDSTGNPLLVNLFCTGAVPDTRHSCEAARNNMIVADNKIESNSRHRIDHIQILFLAHKEGLVSKENITSEMILHFYNCMLDIDETNLPKLCMERKKLEELHKISWRVELSIFPERYDDENLHRESFEKSVSKDVYCDLDAEKILKIPEWRSRIKGWYN